jgi:hypothetical protein
MHYMLVGFNPLKVLPAWATVESRLEEANQMVKSMDDLARGSIYCEAGYG